MTRLLVAQIEATFAACVRVSSAPGQKMTSVESNSEVLR